MNTHQNDWSSEISDSDHVVDLLINEYDTTSMPLPDIELEPHLLISKVRKHYMEYIIKLLSINYENKQKLLNKNIYLPSAIWRCAKNIEMKAAQTCMVVQLYRKNIVAAITELKNDTKKGKLNKNLYECLRKPPGNEKKLQTTLSTTIDCNCQCVCNKRKKFRKTSISPKTLQNEIPDTNIQNDISIYNIPVIANLQADSPQVAQPIQDINHTTSSKQSPLSINVNQTKLSDLSYNPPRISIESQDSDDLMLQLEKLFQCDSQEEDLFEGSLYNNFEMSSQDDLRKKKECNETQLNQQQESVISNQIKSLDERLASLTGLLANNIDNNVQNEKVENPKNNHKPNTSKWLCEEYFLKSKLLELLDQIGDCNRKKLARIKALLTELFGEDSDEECIMSPLEETPEFVISCKERIAPWVVQLLTPHYIKGRIRGKGVFKALAKHLIRLIYQCSRYPQEYEVNSFVSDFLQNHTMIRCEADFKQFRIDNL